MTVLGAGVGRKFIRFRFIIPCYDTILTNLGQAFWIRTTKGAFRRQAGVRCEHLGDHLVLVCSRLVIECFVCASLLQRWHIFTRLPFR
jgi:hypothetical protein